MTSLQDQELPETNRLIAESIRELEHRQSRFERTVATCFCTVAILFGTQCLLLALAMPVYNDMFIDYGAALPAMTTFILGTRALWIGIPIVVTAASLSIARKGKGTHAVAVATISGIFLFFVAQTVTVALLLPITQMAEVVGAMK